MLFYIEDECTVFYMTKKDALDLFFFILGRAACA